MNTFPSVNDWAMQQLAGLLASISGYDEEEQMVAAAAHRIAEALDAEVCALLADDGTVRAVIGFPAHDVPVASLSRVVAEDGGKLDVEGLGTLTARVVHPSTLTGITAVLARSSSVPAADELHLARSMVQVVELALQLRRAADRERELRERSEAQAAELQAANAALVEASAAKDAIISVASHELRTPLTSILGFTATLRRHGAHLSPETRHEYLGVVERQGERLLRLIDDLLTVGRLESGRADPQPRVVPLAGAMRALLETTHHEADVRAAPGVTALVDANHLEQVVLNLLTNAEKYGAPPISIEVTGDDTSVELTVADHGAGVPDDFVPELFDSFSQASRGESRQSTGTGLGLAIVAGLAEANGGDVRYLRRDGRTCFVVRLPVPGDGTISGPGAAPAPPPG